MKLYIIESQNKKVHYASISSNPDKRLAEYNRGKTKSTKSNRPWYIIYTEECGDRVSAREREKYLKSYKGVKEKREIIKKFTKYT